jgi:hypothetical protein
LSIKVLAHVQRCLAAFAIARRLSQSDAHAFGTGLKEWIFLCGSMRDPVRIPADRWENEIRPQPFWKPSMRLIPSVNNAGNIYREGKKQTASMHVDDSARLELNQRNPK